MPYVCVHSVWVSESRRPMCVALALLKGYIALGESESSHYDRVVLINHETTQKLYEKAGFNG